MVAGERQLGSERVPLENIEIVELGTDLSRVDCECEFCGGEMKVSLGHHVISSRLPGFNSSEEEEPDVDIVANNMPFLKCENHECDLEGLSYFSNEFVLEFNIKARRAMIVRGYTESTARFEGDVRVCLSHMRTHEVEVPEYLVEMLEVDFSSEWREAFTGRRIF